MTNRCVKYFFLQDDILKNWTAYTKEYDPLKAGSIDGTDTEPHDKAVTRAIRTHYEPPHGLKSIPARTLFVARLNPKLTKDDLIEVSKCNFSPRIHNHRAENQNLF